MTMLKCWSYMYCCCNNKRT